MGSDMLSVLSEHPEKVFELSKGDGVQYFDSLVKSFLDPIANEYSVLDEIYVDGLDSSQIYGQAKMVLEGVGEKLMQEVLPTLQERAVDKSDENEEDEEEEIEDENEEEIDEQDENEVDGQDSEEQDLYGESDEDIEAGSQDLSDDDIGDIMGEPEEPEEQATYTRDSFGLNDEFFDIENFNKQIMSMEKTANDDDDEIDYMDSMSDEDDEDEEVAYFDDFFPKPAKPQDSSKNTSDRNTASDGESEQSDFDEQDISEGEYDNAMGSAMLDMFEDAPKEDTKALSSFEAHQKQIQEEVAKLEAELIAEKKWTMKGEVTAKSRPEDSLLDDPETVDLEFDRTAKPIPVITQEHTETIEDVIRRRVREEEFDDLPRRVIEDVSKFHKERVEVSEQKSSKSLAELYEDEYHQVDASSEISEETKKQHDEIDAMFTSLNHKLDSLCSAHYVPKPHQGRTLDIKVDDVTAPAIEMEDAQPAYVDSGTALAPQEVYKAGEKQEGKVALKSGLSYAKEELSREDKQRLRRANKRKRANLHNQKEPTSKKTKKNDSNDVVSTLARAKNVTLIDKKGKHTDVKGREKKATTHSGSKYLL